MIAALGIDQSLSDTGLLGLGNGEVVLAEATRNRPELGTIERVGLINQRIENAVIQTEPKIIVIEGFSFASKGQRLDAIHYLGWRIREELERFKADMKIPWIDVAPSQLKKFATGKGNAPKDIILQQVYKHWGYETFNNNIADAYVLAQIGRAYMGEVEGLTSFQMEVIAALKGEKPAAKKTQKKG